MPADSEIASLMHLRHGVRKVPNTGCGAFHDPCVEARANTGNRNVLGGHGRRPIPTFKAAMTQLSSELFLQSAWQLR